jgi:hypothetical protein
VAKSFYQSLIIAMKRILSIAMVVLSVGVLKAQTPMYTDALMMPKKDLGAGLFYTHSQWYQYWEGSRKRDNGNVGTNITQGVTFMGIYGLSNKVTLITTLPYIWTKDTGGTLHGQAGIQDLTVAGKYNFLNLEGGKSNLKLFGLVALTAPMSNYSKDFYPVSIGPGCYGASYRLTAGYTLNKVWFATVSGAYTWRSNIYLDRPSYFKDNQLYNTNEVKMPNQLDFVVRAGYHKEALRAELYYTQQNTMGGGDIRRQDTPYAWSQMNYGKAGGSVMYVSPHLRYIAVRAWGDYTFAGRNVGQSFTFTLGAMYFFHFSKNLN